MAATLTPNEEAQLVQTIEMFEVITQSDPLDYQSLEILKEAYSKLGRSSDVVNTSKRIAQAYVQRGELSSAILEYESILQRYPDDPDVQKALREIESKANSFAAPIESDFADKAAATAPGIKKLADGKPAPADVDDGRQSMQKIFVDGKLVSLADFNLYWPIPNLKDPPNQVVDPFLQILADKQLVPVDKAVKILCDKSRVAYLPLEKYDVDVELARTFPREICQRWCVLPFDKMSKTVLVATANPFNKQAARDLEGINKNRVLWYLASPMELSKAVKKIFR